MTGRRAGGFGVAGLGLVARLKLSTAFSPWMTLLSIRFLVLGFWDTKYRDMRRRHTIRRDFLA